MSYLKDFMPLIATIPLAVVAVLDCQSVVEGPTYGRGAGGEIAALRDEVDALRQQQAEMREQLDFTERVLSQLREGHLGLPKS